MFWIHVDIAKYDATTTSRGAMQEAEMMSDAMKPLAGTHFAVFGLGNTSYELYNKSGKVLDR